MAGAAKVGPWGAAGGAPRDIKSYSVPQRLVSISICSIGCKINGFSFTYVDQKGERTHRRRRLGHIHGIRQTDYHTSRGACDLRERHLQQVGGDIAELVTNRSEHGPYGSAHGPEFSLPLRQGKSEVVAFFGHVGATTLKALGVYVSGQQPWACVPYTRLRPRSSQHLGPCPVKMGPWGGHGGASRDLVTASIPEQLESVTVHSSERSGGRIYGFGYSYLDRDGRRVSVGPWGSKTRGWTENLFLGDSEYVNSISGTYDDYGVTSLRFATNMVEHPPFGCPAAEGLAFSVPLPENCAAVGFFGRSDGDRIIAIGVYVGPHDHHDE